MMKRTIYLIRHAEPAALTSFRPGAYDGAEAKEKIYLGQSNPPLSPNGYNQAVSLSRLLRRRKLHAIFCSDLTRAMQTASVIARYHNCVPVCLKELREIDLGQWDGLPMAEVKRNYPDLYAARGDDIVHFCPPDGESFADVKERVIPAFERLLSFTAGNMAIVAHAGVNRVILCYLQQLELSKLFSVRQKYAQVHIIVQRAAGFRIRERK